MIYFLILVLLFCLSVLSMMGRKGHYGLQQLRGWAYAHRGLHGNGVPENSLEAFRLAMEAGYGMELDVHLLADGNLAVIHDSKLERTTGQEGRVEDLVLEDLKNYNLNGTTETIPELGQVLSLIDGKVPLIIELKCVDNNVASLCDTACKMLQNYSGIYCMESFDPRCIRWLKNNCPEIVRGQLTENYLAAKNPKLPWILRFILKNQMMNFLSLPDFVAYKFKDRKTISNLICRKFWGVTGVTWTIRSQEDYNKAVSEGWIPIFEGFNP